MAAMSVKIAVVQHLSAPTHIGSALFTPLLHPSYIKELNKRKLSTASYSQPLLWPKYKSLDKSLYDAVAIDGALGFFSDLWF